MEALRYERKHFAFIAMLAIMAVAPMLFRGIPGGNDAIQHFEFAQQVVDSNRSGSVFPSFAGNSNHGFGDVGLRVYPPLSYYVLTGSYFVFGEWYFASIFAFFIIFFSGASGVYLWASECFSNRAGLAAAAVFTFAPFHLNEIYNNFLYAQFAAGAVLPFCFLFLTRSLRTGKLADTVLLGVSFAILVITHLPLTVIGSIALGVYAFASIRKENFRRVIHLMASAAIGLLLSGFYWVRMIAEINWVKHSQPEYYGKIWSYQENFLLSVRTFTDFMNDGLSLWFGDLMFGAMLLLCVPAMVFLVRSRSIDRNLLAIGVMFAFGVFMATPLSSPIWDLAGVLQRIQFPWRWVSIVTLSGSVIAGAALVTAGDHLKGSNSKAGLLTAAAALLPFVFLSAFVLRAPHFTPRTEFNTRNAMLSEGETFEGWWPAWAKRQAFSNRSKVLANDRTFEIERWDPTLRTFTIADGQEQDLSISTFYYPHWKAFIGGQESMAAYDAEGRIQLRIPSNAVEVELRFVEPTSVKSSVLISAIGWLAVLTVLAALYRRDRKTYVYS